MLQTADGIASGGIDVRQTAGPAAVVGGPSSGSLSGPGGLLPLGLGVAVVPINRSMGHRLASLAVGIELGEASAEGLLGIWFTRTK